MQAGTSSRVNAVLDALHALLPPLLPNEFEVLEGEAPQSPADEAVSIAPSDPDTPGVVVRRGKDPGLGNAFVEEVEVAIVARSYTGDNDMKSRRERCQLVVAAVEELIRQHTKHEPAWDLIQMGNEMSWHPVYTEQGSNCFVGLSIVATGLL